LYKPDSWDVGTETNTTFPARLNSGILALWPNTTGWAVIGAVGAVVVSMATDIAIYVLVLGEDNNG
jgi:hypothetical protein